MELSNKVLMGLLLDNYSSLLTDKQKEVTESYYLFDLSISEIAENNKTTRQAIFDTLQKAEKQLVNFEDKLCLLKQKQTIKKELEQLKEIEDINQIKAQIDLVISKI